MQTINDAVAALHCFYEGEIEELKVSVNSPDLDVRTKTFNKLVLAHQSRTECSNEEAQAVVRMASSILDLSSPESLP